MRVQVWSVQKWSQDSRGCSIFDPVLQTFGGYPFACASSSVSSGESLRRSTNASFECGEQINLLKESVGELSCLHSMCLFLLFSCFLLAQVTHLQRVLRGVSLATSPSLPSRLEAVVDPGTQVRVKLQRKESVLSHRVINQKLLKSRWVVWGEVVWGEGKSVGVLFSKPWCHICSFPEIDSVFVMKGESGCSRRSIGTESL